MPKPPFINNTNHQGKRRRKKIQKIERNGELLEIGGSIGADEKTPRNRRREAIKGESRPRVPAQHRS
jgi:hypothetical protein